jgi:hypothetical protein
VSRERAQLWPKMRAACSTNGCSPPFIPSLPFACHL